MNKAGVAVTGFCCKCRQVELFKRIGLDPFDNPIQNMGVQVARRIGVLSRNCPVHQGEESRTEGMGEMLNIKCAGRPT